jgi:hypothetical membrane protein
MMTNACERKRSGITRAAGICGVFIPIVIFTCLGLAMALSPWFTWTHHALSDLGISDNSALFFNYGMIIGGILIFIFSLGLIKIVSKRTGAYILTVSSLALIGIGLFPETLFPLHFITSASFFILLIIALLILGLTLKQDRFERSMGLLALFFAEIAICSLFSLFRLPGIAIPEAFSCFPAFFWCMVVGIKMTSR